MAIPNSILEKAANSILSRARSDRTVGPNWVYRYIQRLPPTMPYVLLKSHPINNLRLGRIRYYSLLDLPLNESW